MSTSVTTVRSKSRLTGKYLCKKQLSAWPKYFVDILKGLRYARCRMQDLAPCQIMSAALKDPAYIGCNN